MDVVSWSGAAASLAGALYLAGSLRSHGAPGFAVAMYDRSAAGAGRDGW